jgi:predicted nucleotidyltransferase
MLGHNEDRTMNQMLQLGDTRVDGVSLAEVCRRYGVKELSVFGSAVRGEMGPESDIDILVEFEPDACVGVIKFESLVEELESLSGRRIDLVTKRGLKPWVRPHVLKDARVIYAA